MLLVKDHWSHGRAFPIQHYFPCNFRHNLHLCRDYILEDAIIKQLIKFVRNIIDRRLRGLENMTWSLRIIMTHFSVIIFYFCLFSFTQLLKLIHYYLFSAYYMLSTGPAWNYECPDLWWSEKREGKSMNTQGCPYRGKC